MQTEPRARTSYFRYGLLAVLLACVLGAASHTRAQTPPKGNTTRYVVEYYYKASWGHADEFIRLFKKNHYPLLQKQVESGRLLEVSAVKPRLHGTEDGRWDYRVTLVYKDAQTANDPSGEEALARQLYPDQGTFKREEQRRFEILLAHWDLPITDLSLEE
jgi:hypothetical protein